MLCKTLSLKEVSRLLLKIFRVEIRVIDVAALIGEIIPVASNIL